VLFAIQRQDARRFAPHAAMDPVFAETLQVAKAQGVEVHAYRSIVQPTEIRLDVPVEVEL
jgi:sugar fermentation stimulation protein A